MNGSMFQGGLDNVWLGIDQEVIIKCLRYGNIRYSKS